MNIFLKFSNNKNCVSTLEEIKEILKKYNHSFELSENDVKKDDEKVAACDLIITVGGDGTLLSMNRQAIKYNRPILGINVGRLGFLTAIEGHQLCDLCRFFEHPEEFEIKKHSLLKARVNKSKWNYCLNDIVIAKHMFSNTISTAVYCNDSNIGNIICDSVIVATATGSTAYSLSAGGPIVDNDLDALVISPVAVHSLNATPMVLAKDKVITIKFDENRKQDIYVSFDGENHRKISEKDTVTVQLSKKALNIFSAKNMGQFAKVDKKIKLR
ncbi:MAG: NAD(+)/NADH kinase [Oscillospiraceae bacterium]|nr:NAD(+)/NADH kinase [Oscillospiraceae bacterium]